MNGPVLATARAQSAFADALLDPARPCPPGLRTWNGSDPARRLAVYRNNVVSSLIDALADTFPVVQRLVGTEFFRAMAGVFAPPAQRLHGRLDGRVCGHDQHHGLRGELARAAQDREPVGTRHA